MENLSLGAQGEAVREMQIFLQDLGYDIGSKTGVDGIFGRATQAAVQQYQRDRGLSVTGNWDNETKALSDSAEVEQTADTAASSIAQRLGEIAWELAQLANELT